jgi:hypothetical protein
MDFEGNNPDKLNSGYEPHDIVSEFDKLLSRHGITEDELDAVESYTGNDFLEMNDKLYSLPTGIPAEKIQPEFDGDDVPDRIADLDSALERVAAPKDFIVYSGLSSDLNVEDFIPGKKFRFKGYRSTSINPNIALNYNSRVNKSTARRQTLLLQIEVKKGSKGMYVEEFSANPGESEYLLPRGSTLKIKSGPHKLVGSNAYSQDPNLEVLYFNCVLT